MKLTINTLDDFLIVHVSGAVDINATGPLSDALVAGVCDGWKKLIVDLSEVSHVTHAGARGLIVAAKLLQTGRRGELRICGANEPTDALLRSFGFHHLLKCDPTLEMSILALSFSTGRTRSEAPSLWKNVA